MQPTYDAPTFDVAAPTSMIPWHDVPYMICSFIIFSVAFAILRNVFGRLYERVRGSEKGGNNNPNPPSQSSWRKRFKRATKEEEGDKKEKLIDIELPKPKDGSSPSSGEIKDGHYEQLKGSLEEEKQAEPSYLQKGTESLKQLYNDRKARFDQGYQQLESDNLVSADYQNQGQIDSGTPTYIESAKNIIGLGAGSKFQPIKAGVVKDDEEAK